MALNSINGTFRSLMSQMNEAMGMSSEVPLWQRKMIQWQEGHAGTGGSSKSPPALWGLRDASLSREQVGSSWKANSTWIPRSELVRAPILVTLLASSEGSLKSAMVFKFKISGIWSGSSSWK